MITNIAYKIEKGRIYATITRDTIVEGEIITIKPSANNNTTYTKYLPNEGLVLDIDLTPYCKSAIFADLRDVIGALEGNNDFHFVGSRLGTIAYPQVNDADNENTFYHDNISGTPKVLTKLPYLQISRGDVIFLALSTYKDIALRVVSGNFDVTMLPNKLKETDILYIAIPSGFGIANTLVLENNQGYIDRPNIPIRVVPGGMNTRRLIWRNELGGIDAWSFEFLRESSFATSSEVFYSSTNGYTRTNRISERVHIIETRELDDITAEVVAYVIASPEVYLMENDTLIPIDIVTEECRTYSDTELTAIQVAYRLKEREML